MGGPVYPAGMWAGLYGEHLGLAVVGNTPYITYRQGQAYDEGFDPLLTMTLDRATGDWSALTGTAPNGFCSDFAVVGTAADAQQVCATFDAHRGDMDDENCGLQVMCTGL